MARGARDVHTLTEDELQYLTEERLQEWYELGGHCSRCEREGWINRQEMTRKWSKAAIFMSLQPRLRCLKCGNRQGNRFIVASMPR